MHYTIKLILITLFLIMIPFNSICQNSRKDSIIEEYYKILGLNFDYDYKNDNLFDEAIFNVLTNEEYIDQEFGVFYIVSSITHTDVYFIIIEENKFRILNENQYDEIIDIIMFLQQYQVDIITMKNYIDSVINLMQTYD